MNLLISFLQTIWYLISNARKIILNSIFIFAFIFFLILIFSNKEEKLHTPAALVLNPSGRIVEQKTYQSPASLLLGSMNSHPETLLKDLLDSIHFASNDSRINGIVLDLKDMGHVELSKLQEISIALKEFKKSGKSIISIGDHYNQKQYYLSTMADQILMHPSGGIELTGFGSFRNYYKSALEKLKVQVHVFRVGTYKSALEPFFRDSMSEKAKEANLAWLTILWDSYKKDIHKRRKLKIDNIDNFINELDTHLKEEKGDLAKLALNIGFVDTLSTRSQTSDFLIKKYGHDHKKKTYNQISFLKFLKMKKSERLIKFPSINNVGVIIAKGNILDGDQAEGNIGGDTIAALIRKARLDKSVKAIVLRIDSGGGSAFASEIIREEVLLAQKSGKPVIASFGSVAASGGYWIAAPADEIWASPTTITGSIGIFGAFPTFENSLETLGVFTDGVGTTKLSNPLDPTRPINPLLQNTVQQIIENGYERFLEIVSKGRGMSKEDVNKIAQGRVWAGTSALENGLVDHLGFLSNAIQSAAKKAGLKEFDIKYIEKDLSPKEEFLKQLLNNTDVSTIQKKSEFKKLINNIQKHLSFLDFLNDPHHTYAHSMLQNTP